VKAIMSGILVAAVIAGLASLALTQVQKPSYERYATSSVRVGEPGENLVGGRAGWGEPDSAGHDG
jgi:hypothetical protein